jgi:hypothetical protein
MIVHIVFLKLKEQNKEANIQKTKAMLEDMVGKVPQLRKLEVGIDFNGSERACDMSLYTEFDSKEDLHAYAVHPVHQKVIEFIRDVAEFTKVVDYEK